jgi:hypothetical protein
MDSPGPSRSPRRPTGQGLKRLSNGAAAFEDLASFEGTDEEQRLRRLEKDAELVTTLMLRGYDGPEWREVAAVLAGYGVQVIRSWVYSGQIFVQCSRKGIRLQAPGEPGLISRDDSGELANETVAEAIVGFKEKVLKLGKWRPDKGASLRTFFVGQCIFQFPNVYRSWLAQNVPLVPEGLLAQTVLPPIIGADDLAILSITLDKLPPNDPGIMNALGAAGFTQADIAGRLGLVSWRAVESRQRRAKLKAAR